MKGWFEDTLPALDRPLDVVLLDVDLTASTRTCVRWLYPRIRAGGVLLSQDGHLRGTIDLLADERFWRDEVGMPPPAIHGLGVVKLVEIPRGVSHDDVVTQNETGERPLAAPR